MVPRLGAPHWGAIRWKVSSEITSASGGVQLVVPSPAAPDRCPGVLADRSDHGPDLDIGRDHHRTTTLCRQVGLTPPRAGSAPDRHVCLPARGEGWQPDLKEGRPPGTLGNPWGPLYGLGRIGESPPFYVEGSDVNPSVGEKLFDQSQERSCTQGNSQPLSQLTNSHPLRGCSFFFHHLPTSPHLDLGRAAGDPSAPNSAEGSQQPGLPN